MGALVKSVAVSLTQLLASRAETKRMARSANQTMIQPQENNPLKFAPTVEEALQLMFGPRTSGFLDAQHSFQESFRDLNAHQIKTFSAMQHAVRMLAEDLDPDAISETVEADRGIGGLVGSRKAKLWDAYVTRWRAKTASHGNGLVDAFMIYFAECYERGGRDK
jgi:type VI secretion system protein ImpI